MRAILAALLLAACSKGGLVDTAVNGFDRSPRPLPQRPPDSCHTEPFREYVGQPSGVLDSLVFVQPIRVFLPGSDIPDDYDPVRINFDLDGSGAITRVWCG